MRLEAASSGGGGGGGHKFRVSSLMVSAFTNGADADYDQSGVRESPDKFALPADLED